MSYSMPHHSSQGAAADSFPIVFTIEGSNRHEIILLTPQTTTLPSLTSTISHLITTSPNCAEPLAKYKKSDSSPSETIASIRVRWSFGDGTSSNGTPGAAFVRDKHLFPKETRLTEENFEAVMKMIVAGGWVGRDVLDVRMETKMGQRRESQGNY